MAEFLPEADTVRHHLVLEKVYRRVSDAELLGLLKPLLGASGETGCSAKAV